MIVSLNKIKEKREEKNISQEKMAEKMNISQQVYSKIESGNRSLLAKHILEISKILEVPASYFLEENRGTGSEPFSLPLIPFGAIAGFNGFDSEGVCYEDCERYVVPEFEIAKAEFVIRASGSSMYPKYSNGDILACRKIKDILFFQWGKVYVIDSSQGCLVKRVFEHENPEMVLLVSDNKEKYPPFAIPKNDIRSLSIVLGVIRME